MVNNQPTGYTYTFEDLSGVSNETTDPNPYNALLYACSNDPTQIAARYEVHRTTRESQQRQLLLSTSFPGVTIDPILRQILDEEALPQSQKTGYQDPRHCLVLWARPPARVKALVLECQQRLREVVPNMYFQTQDKLHMTALELAHSLTPTNLETLLLSIPPALISSTTDLPNTLSQASCRATLHKPLLVYDGSAVALSYLPVASNPSIPPTTTNEDIPASASSHFTYHSLRAALYELFTAASIPVASRYVVPSAHMTIARFVSDLDTGIELPDPSGTLRRVNDPRRIQKFVEKIEEINGWLRREVWGMDEAFWSVGEERGLDYRKGRLWYGGGESVRVGRGIGEA